MIYGVDPVGQMWLRIQNKQTNILVGMNIFPVQIQLSPEIMKDNVNDLS